MTIAVIGPGAVGTTIAAELKAVLPDTQLIGRHNKTMTYFRKILLKHKTLMLFHTITRIIHSMS